MSDSMMNPMPDTRTNSPSSRSGPIQSPVGVVIQSGVAAGAHPELSASHRDVRLAHLADLSDESSVGHGASRQLNTDRVGSAAFTPSSQLTSGRQRDQHK